MSNWDNEIDALARELTGDRQDPSFKARVLARLGEERPQRRTAWRIGIWSPVALGIVALVALLIVWPGWRSGKIAVNSEPNSNSASTTSSRSASPSADGVAGDERGRTPDGTGNVHPPPSALASSIARRERPGPMVRVEQANELAPAPIEVDPLAIEQMEAMESLDVPALNVEPLELVALSAE
jgi:hypothetical protein